MELCSLSLRTVVEEWSLWILAAVNHSRKEGGERGFIHIEGRSDIHYDTVIRSVLEYAMLKPSSYPVTNPLKVIAIRYQ